MPREEISTLRRNSRSLYLRLPVTLLLLNPSVTNVTMWQPLRRGWDSTLGWNTRICNLKRWGSLPLDPLWPSPPSRTRGGRSPSTKMVMNLLMYTSVLVQMCNAVAVTVTSHVTACMPCQKHAIFAFFANVKVFTWTVNMFTVSYQNLSFEAVTYRPVWPAVSALVVLYCITCSLCLHRCHSNKNDLLTYLLVDTSRH